MATEQRQVAQDAVPRPALQSVGLLEAFVGVALVTTVAMFVPGNWGLLGVQPHPLWLVVLAIAIRYGTAAGYAGGAFAACAYWLMLWLQPGSNGQLPAAYELLQPLLLFVGGAITSELVQSERERGKHAEDDRRRVTAELQEVTQRCAALQEVHEELQKRIVGQTASIISLYEVAKQLTTLDAKALCKSTVNLVVNYIGADAASLYLRNSQGDLELQARVPPVDSLRRTVLDPRSGLVSRALREARVVTLHEQLPSSMADLGEGVQAVMAGPLLDESGRVCGVVVVERMPFMKFTPATVQLFDLLVDWASTALQSAESHALARARNIMDEETGVYTSSHTLALLRKEFNRSRRYQLPLSLIVMRMRSFSNHRSASRIQSELLARVKPHLRSVDVLGQAGEPGTLALILPLTELAGARRVALRIRDDIQANIADDDLGLVTVRTGVAALSNAHSEPEVMLASALAGMDDAALDLIIGEAAS